MALIRESAKIKLRQYLDAGILGVLQYIIVRILSCQPRVTVMSCFVYRVYEVIRGL